MLQFTNIDAEDSSRRSSIKFQKLIGKFLKSKGVPKDVSDFNAKQAYVLNYVDREVRPHFPDNNLLHDTTLFRGYCSNIQFGTIENLQAGIAQKLLGVYEVELTDQLETLENRRYDWIINIGAAEGLYSIRFSRTWKGIPVYSFEQDFATRQLLREMKNLNKVKNVVILGEFKLEYMKSFEKGSRGMIFSDCEGFEQLLFTEQTLPSLVDIDLVIETHDHLAAGVHAGLVQVLSATHKVEQIDQLTLKERCTRVNEDWFRTLPEKAQINLLNEDRHPSNRWIIASSLSN